MANKDVVVYNGEEFEIESGLTEADVRASMQQIFASAGHAKITKTKNGDGSVVWSMTESGGDKGSC